MEKITEAESHYNHLEKMTTRALLENINNEDQKVAGAVRLQLPAIEKAVDAIADKMLAGGRLFYMGAGTSGRLGILDASECPPTFGVPHDLVIGLIAGGDSAIRKAKEFAEDDAHLGIKDLAQYDITAADSVIGIAASGTTPYVIGALENARKKGLTTACITCNPGAPVSKAAEFPIEINAGPEFVTGSTRMKSGTAQKMVLNMISTTLMIKLGRVQGNRMVDMQLSNKKLIERGTRMVSEALHIDTQEAKQLLKAHGSVRKAVQSKK